MRGASISDSSCATRSASACRAGCRIARRPPWPRFWRYCAPPDAGWSRFPHGTHSSRLCAGFRHRSPPPATPQRRPLSPRAAKHRTVHVVVVAPALVARVIRRVDEDAVHLPRIEWQQSLQSVQVIPVNNKVAVQVRLADGLAGVHLKRTEWHGQMVVVNELFSLKVQLWHISPLAFARPTNSSDASRTTQGQRHLILLHNLFKSLV